MKNMLAIFIVALSFVKLLGFNPTPINTIQSTYVPSPMASKPSPNNKGFLKIKQNTNTIEENHILYKNKNETQEIDQKKSPETDARPNARQEARNKTKQQI